MSLKNLTVADWRVPNKNNLTVRERRLGYGIRAALDKDKVQDHGRNG